MSLAATSCRQGSVCIKLISSSMNVLHQMYSHNQGSSETVPSSSQSIWTTSSCFEELHTAEKGTLVTLAFTIFFFFLGGALPPLRPLPFGIVVITNFVRFGFDLDFLYHWTNRCNWPSFSAVATVWEHKRIDCQLGQSASQQYWPSFITLTRWGRGPE